MVGVRAGQEDKVRRPPCSLPGPGTPPRAAAEPARAPQARSPRLSSMNSPEPPASPPGPSAPTWPTQPTYSNLGEPLRDARWEAVARPRSPLPLPHRWPEQGGGVSQAAGQIRFSPISVRERKRGRAHRLVKTRKRESGEVQSAAQSPAGKRATWRPSAADRPSSEPGPSSVHGVASLPHRAQDRRVLVLFPFRRWGTGSRGAACVQGLMLRVLSPPHR